MYGALHYVLFSILSHFHTCKIGPVILLSVSYSSITKKKCNAIPVQASERPRWFQEIQAPRFPDNWHMKVVRSSAALIGRLYPQNIFLVLISVRGWVDPRALLRPEGLCQWKIPMTVGNRTHNLPACRFNQLRHRVPQILLGTWIICSTISSVPQ